MLSGVVHVEVETQPDGTLLVQWEVEGDPVAVDVATGDTPEHVDHEHEATVPAGQLALRIPRPAGKRYFVSVAPHGGGPAAVAADRRVPFAGVANFRDLGGYRTGSGGWTRWGLVFRADGLYGLTSDDLVLYEQLGLRTVYDLRRDVEREELPNPVPSTPLVLIGRPADNDALPASMTADAEASAEDGERFLHTLYLGLLEHAAGDLGRLYTELATGDGLPAVFHCHAGKDRTGMVAALLLEVLGVAREKVLDDYELTARYRLRAQQDPTYQRLIERGLAPEAAAGILAAPRWAMQHALADLDQAYGDVEQYLVGPAGVEPAALAALRDRLVAPP